MPARPFHKILLIRFTAYLLVFTGILGIAFQFGPLLTAEINYRKDRLLGIKRRISANIITSQTIATSSAINTQPTQSIESGGGSSGFGAILGLGDQVITPLSTDFGIVIEKINANARIVSGVNPGSERDYTKALTQGVAEALGSTPPGQPGNLYLFSHSTDAPWNIVRYNAIFYLLRELVPGDKVIIFYQNKRYDYVVYDKTIARADEVSYLTNKYDAPVLTLQTCDPPGTLLNRLIVRAKLVNS